MISEVRNYILANGRVSCPPEWLDVFLLRDCHLKPVDLGIEGPITVGDMLGWLAAWQGEALANEVKEAQRKNAEWLQRNGGGDA